MVSQILLPPRQCRSPDWVRAQVPGRDPSGTTYTAANEYTISLAIAQVVLAPECSITQTYAA